MKSHNYFVYITTNPSKTVLYVGVTNDLSIRLEQHKENRRKAETFAGRYFCYKLLYYERHTLVHHAIEREKELKLLSREQKIELVKIDNPYLQFLKVDD
ncbi:putative endonuclease [Pontibacter aydingkolensis]|uniref:GIY-YIG nuclease family protein n=1 Tax=Pontibacter aydingkolensis TaxID=1911536 RepID=A0ABS7CRU7_9BACT|nr:GIY-YIG nuclease family protein [Pontibacter aydingkolensis]MBW7466563.1 GIY-YIG nuclease family protein [Pontibacter aydingkolensis]